MIYNQGEEFEAFDPAMELKNDARHQKTKDEYELTIDKRRRVFNMIMQLSVYATGVYIFYVFGWQNPDLKTPDK